MQEKSGRGRPPSPRESNHPPVSYDLGSNRDPCVFRLDYDMPGAGSVTSWHYIDGLIDLRGRIRCVFSPIELVLSGKNSSGPLALFVRLFTVSYHFKCHQRLSNQMPPRPIYLNPMIFSKSDLFC